MGIYTTKFALESGISPDDVIQSPGDVGVDLDAVEDAIMGDDGIEAHSEEIEDAQSGVVGDPLEEAYMIMYESQYNMNQIMRAIGVSELREAGYGRELVLEAADIKGFFKKIKDAIVKMFARIVAVFKKSFQNIKTTFMKDKELCKQYRSVMQDGYNTDWEIEGFNYKDKITLDVDINRVKEYVKDTETGLDYLKNPNAGAHADISMDDAKEFRRGLMKEICGHEVDTIPEMVEIAYKFLRNGEESPIKLNKSNVKFDTIIKILTSDNEAKALEDLLKKIKTSYKETLKDIKKMEDKLTADDYGDNLARAINLCKSTSDLLVFEKNALNSACGVCIKAAKSKRSQARKLAMTWVRSSNLIRTKKDGKITNVAYKNEGTVFGGLNLI